MCSAKPFAQAPLNTIQGKGRVSASPGQGRASEDMGSAAAHTTHTPFPRALRSNGDVGSRHGADFSYFFGLLKSKLLIGCLFHLLFILCEQQNQVFSSQNLTGHSEAVSPSQCLSADIHVLGGQSAW